MDAILWRAALVLMGLLLASESKALITSEVGRGKLRAACEERGGVFREFDNGDYECRLPNGRLVYCMPSLDWCLSVDPPRKSDLRKLLGPRLEMRMDRD